MAVLGQSQPPSPVEAHRFLFTFQFWLMVGWEVGEKCCEDVSRLGRKSSDGLCCQPCVASLKAEVVGGACFICSSALSLQSCPGGKFLLIQQSQTVT